MNTDPDFWLLSIFGAGLLTAGAALRSAFITARAVAAGSMPPPAPPRDDHELRAKLDQAESQLSALRGELSHSTEAKEALRAETVEQRQRAERKIQSAHGEIQRLALELDAEKSRTAEQLATLERAVQTANEERDAARAKVEALERLVEGVRARSRELAEELRSLKAS